MEKRLKEGKITANVQPSSNADKDERMGKEMPPKMTLIGPSSPFLSH